MLQTVHLRNAGALQVRFRNGFYCKGSCFVLVPVIVWGGTGAMANRGPSSSDPPRKHSGIRILGLEMGASGFGLRL